jgi:uncharacterized protein (UPF0303 family)
MYSNIVHYNFQAIGEFSYETLKFKILQSQNETPRHILFPEPHPMPIADDILAIARQEKELLLPSFDNDTAWRIGLTLRELAAVRNQNIVADIRRFGSPHQQLFYTAFPGTTPDNQRWVARKIAVVSRFHRSSYSVGLYLQQQNISFSDRYNLPEADYAAHGGCFPIHVAGAGIIGAVTVSGLTQRDDHNLAVEALCLESGLDYEDLRLAMIQ